MMTLLCFPFTVMEPDFLNWEPLRGKKKHVCNGQRKNGNRSSLPASPEGLCNLCSDLEQDAQGMVT